MFVPFKTEIPEPTEDYKDFVPIGQYKKLQKSLFESQVSKRYLTNSFVNTDVARKLGNVEYATSFAFDTVFFKKSK